MKFCHLSIFACLVSAALVTADSAQGTNNVIKGTPKCDSNKTHCVYIKYGFTYGDINGNEVVCDNIDQHGRGVRRCEFPEYSVAKVACTNDRGHNIFVTFGSTESSFRKDEKVDALVYWSSKKFQFDEKTNEPGDDVYITCEKPTVHS